MKELYTAPEAEIVYFVAEESLASDNNTSVLGWDITDNADGGTNYDRWFN